MHRLLPTTRVAATGPGTGHAGRTTGLVAVALALGAPLGVGWSQADGGSERAPQGGAVRWIRPADDQGPCRWGIEGGIEFAVWPAAVGGRPGTGGPRGLIRIGYPILPPDNAPALVNFIAVEPVVPGRGRGYSELERSVADGEPGRLLWPAPPDSAAEGGPVAAVPGEITHPEPDRPAVEQLTVRLNVEPFANGAHVYVLATIRSDLPDLLELQVFAAPDSARLEYCVLTATMGNYERLRLLHLRDRVVSSLALYGDYGGDAFAPETYFPLAELPRTPAGDVLVAATTDEADPAAVQPDAARPWFWKYAGRKVTQFWMKRAGTFAEGLAARANARRVYWAGDFPIPGGVAYENLELVEPFEPGRRFWFGITPRTPDQLLRGEGL